jgi:hypothetical protein
MYSERQREKESEIFFVSSLVKNEIFLNIHIDNEISVDAQKKKRLEGGKEREVANRLKRSLTNLEIF